MCIAMFLLEMFERGRVSGLVGLVVIVFDDALV